MQDTPKPARITMKTIGEGILDIFNVERGLLYTLFALALKPDQAIQTYFYENRDRLIKPFRYLIFTAAIATFITIQYMKKSGFLVEMRKGFTTGYTPKNNEELAAVENYFKLLNEVYINYFNLLIVLSVPIIAMVTYWFFRKKFNYAEHLVINSYVTSQLSAYYILLTPLLLIYNFLVVSYIYTFLTFIYSIFVYVKIFKERLLSGVLKSIAAIIIYFIIYYLFIMIVFSGIFIFQNR